MANKIQHLKVAVSQDGAVILDTRRGQITTLNPSGAFIWQALERGETIESIAANLALETGEPVEVLELDLRGFLDSLREQQLLS